MRNVAKLATIAAVSGIVLASSLASASAFQLPEAVSSADARGRQAASAYAEDGQAAATRASSVLSSAEIRHITWCASRYRLAYDAVNDTYLSDGGTRARCLSPR
jgi:long-subunit fatty acid transport protein